MDETTFERPEHGFTVTVLRHSTDARETTPYDAGHQANISSGVLTVLDAQDQPVRIYGPAGWLHITFGSTS